MKARSEPQSEGQTYGDMAATNLRRRGWELEVNRAGSDADNEMWIVCAQKNGRKVAVSAPDRGIALLEAERQVRMLSSE